MPLGFINDAIVLSGVFGTQLKSKIIHDYYNLWWRLQREVNLSNMNIQPQL